MMRYHQLQLLCAVSCTVELTIVACVQAVADYTQAVELGPENPEYLQHRARCYQVLGDPALAEKDLTRAVHIQGATSK